MKFKHGIYRWLPEKEWDAYICDELRPIIAWLAEREIGVLAVGDWNAKAPDPVIFMDQKIPDEEVLKEFRGTNEKLLLENDFVGCHLHRMSVVYEGKWVKKK